MADLIPLKAGRNICGHSDLNYMKKENLLKIIVVSRPPRPNETLTRSNYYALCDKSVVLN